MKRKEIIYYPVFPSEDELGSERSDHIKKWITEELLPQGVVTEDESKANAYLVATGDGGMTKAARNKCEGGKLLFGVNCGTLGFLMNQVGEAALMPRFFDEVNKVEVTLLKGTFYQANGESLSYLAFNDVFCGGNIADFITFNIKGSLSHFRDRTVKGNGVFISTPQGTTGFALNARGSSSVLPLDTSTLYIGGVATGPYPNSVFSPQRVEIDVLSRHKVFGYADGYEQEAKDICRIVVEPTSHQVTLGFFKDVDFEARRRGLAQKAEVGAE
jgi:NAD+ kinase